MGLFYAVPLKATPVTKNQSLSTSYLLTKFGHFQAAPLLSRVGGWRWVVIIKPKAKLSSSGTGLANWN